MKLTEKKIENYIKKLQKYCHHPKCKKWNECPENSEMHEKCSKRLGIDTAIAWEIKDDLVTLKYHVRLDKWSKLSLQILNPLSEFIFYFSCLDQYNSVECDKLYNILLPLKNDIDGTIEYIRKGK